MNLKNKISKIFQNPLIQNINFALQGISVSGKELEKIGKLVEGEKIIVKVNPKLPRGGGDFQAENGKMYITFQSDNPPVPTVIHEAVHALLHYHKCFKTSIFTHEAAASLAETIYKLKADFSYRKKHEGSFNLGSTERIYQEAIKLIDKHKLLQNKPTFLKWGDYQELRNAIKAHPNLDPWIGDLETIYL